jgi:hypothetical protein
MQDKATHLETTPVAIGFKIDRKMTELMKINVTAIKSITVGEEPIIHVESFVYVRSVVDSGLRPRRKGWKGKKGFCYVE